MSDLEQLHRLYDLWQAAQDRDAPTWPKNLRCPSDCSKCCERSPAVSLTALEALDAAHAVEALDEPLRMKIRQRVRALAEQIDSDSTSSGLSGPCPLLENGRCSIYANRPFVCRAYGFSAEEGNIYFGCEVLQPIVESAGEMRMPSLAAVRAACPSAEVIDRNGRALPELGVLAELLDRLL